MLVNTIIINKPYLAWYIKDPKNLSEESVLEHVLNYGNWEDVQQFISLKGIQETAAIFHRSFQNKRTNYQPSIRAYFTRYFDHRT